MIRWYADNSEARSSAGIPVPDIYLFGGIAVNEQAGKELCSMIKRIKSTYRRAADFPIKWCFKDLEKDYRANRLTKLYSRLLQDSRTWRREIFSGIASIELSILISIIFSYGRCRETLLETKENVTRFGFSNALQRVGLYIKDLASESAEVILDWPDKNKRSLFDLEYRSAYQKGISAVYGSGYISGPLKSLDFSDSVLFTGTDQCSLLQISDLIVGATRELVEEALGQRRNSLGASLLKLIRGRFCGAPSMVIGRGLSISPRQGDFYSRVKGKVYELYR